MASVEEMLWQQGFGGVGKTKGRSVLPLVLFRVRGFHLKPA